MFSGNLFARSEAKYGAQEYSLKGQVVDAFVCKVITKCDDAVNSVNSEPDKAFIRQLSGYLDTRKKEFNIFSDDNLQLDDRATFIQELIPLVQSSNIIQQRDKLKEENIRRFKGFFSQRLYDILVARRTELLNQPSYRRSPSPR